MTPDKYLNIEKAIDIKNDCIRKVDELTGTTDSPAKLDPSDGYLSKLALDKLDNPAALDSPSIPRRRPEITVEGDQENKEEEEKGKEEDEEKQEV